MTSGEDRAKQGEALLACAHCRPVGSGYCNRDQFPASQATCLYCDGSGKAKPAPPGNDTNAKRGWATYQATVWCGACAEWFMTARKNWVPEARIRGWSNTRDRGWLCPECASARSKA